MSVHYKGVWPSTSAKRYFYWAKNWSGSAMTYGTASAIATAFFFDWKYVLRHVPIINTKWKDDQ